MRNQYSHNKTTPEGVALSLLSIRNCCSKGEGEATAGSLSKFTPRLVRGGLRARRAARGGDGRRAEQLGLGHPQHPVDHAAVGGRDDQGELDAGGPGRVVGAEVRDRHLRHVAPHVVAPGRQAEADVRRVLGHLGDLVQGRALRGREVLDRQLDVAGVLDHPVVPQAADGVEQVVAAVLPRHVHGPVVAATHEDHAREAGVHGVGRVEGPRAVHIQPPGARAAVDGAVLDHADGQGPQGVGARDVAQGTGRHCGCLHCWLRRSYQLIIDGQ